MLLKDASGETRIRKQQFVDLGEFVHLLIANAQTSNSLVGLHWPCPEVLGVRVDMNLCPFGSE